MYCRSFKLLIDSIRLTDTKLSYTDTKTVYQTVKSDKILNSDHLRNVEHVMQSTFQNVYITPTTLILSSLVSEICHRMQS